MAEVGIQKQKRDGLYVLLMLLAMIGIGAIMIQKEWNREKETAYETGYKIGLTIQPILEQGRRIILENRYVAEEDASNQTQNSENDAGNSDVGVEENEIPSYTIGVTDSAYFNDALFIGDSRTVGIAEYGYFEEADFFADVSMSVYKVEKRSLYVDGIRCKLEKLLSENTYGKIYIMLGINELGYDFDYTVNKYRALLENIRTSQPDAIIYICANLHVTKEQSESDKLFNNMNINRFNEAISQMADEEQYFYIDVNVLFDDAEGHLSEEYSSDNAHVKGKYYVEWCDWLLTQAIVRTL